MKLTKTLDGFSETSTSAGLAREGAYRRARHFIRQLKSNDPKIERVTYKIEYMCTVTPIVLTEE